MGKLSTGFAKGSIGFIEEVYVKIFKIINPQAK